MWLSTILAADMAIDAVNKNETILKDYEMKLLALDGQCSGDMVLKAFIDYVRLPHFNRMVGILGNIEWTLQYHE